ncbi:MAG: outer membrane protein assembly factor BamD [Alistipes sp.]|nr:outer membrane protein assembly factor BamD [Alistipes sp.]MBO7312557.1 outer membrane protein assembly factor BamD [Alistipes sp.]
MRRFLGYIVALVSVTTIAISCSVVNEAIKSGDPQYVYDQAVMLYNTEKWDKASTLFETCRHVYMGTPREDSLSFYNARCKFKQHNWSDASMLLDDYRRKFTRSPFIEEAEGMYALCHFYMSPSPERDQTMTTQAIISITEFISRYPESEHIDEFNEMLNTLTGRLMEKSYLNAYTYYKIGKYKSAIVAFKNAMKKHPESPYRENMMYYTTVSAYRLAANSVEVKQMDRYLAMLDHYYSFLAEYPESKHIKELGRMAKDARNFIDKNRKTEDNA